MVCKTICFVLRSIFLGLNFTHNVKVLNFQKQVVSSMNDTGVAEPTGFTFSWFGVGAVQWWCGLISSCSTVRALSCSQLAAQCRAFVNC